MKNWIFRALVAVSLITCTFLSKAASVDTVVIYSNAMHKNIRCVVITPESYKNPANAYPVVYLLHGYSGNYSNWILKVPVIKQYADEFQLMIVCPDGDYSSWYVDSPADSTMKYETYISAEVPHYIDSAYHTIARREARAITGLSMGGHGGLSLGWKHADLFGAAGSMSGVFDLTPWRNKYDISRIFGDSTVNATPLYKSSVVNIVKEYPFRLSAVIFDCGIHDPFIENNRQLHKELLQLNIPHDYIERDGTHNWDYWTKAIGYQLLFFHRFFTGK